MPKQKNRIFKAALVGGLAGLVISALAISSYSAKRAIDYQIFLRDKKNLPRAELHSVSEEDARKAFYVGVGAKKLTNRKNPLYTSGLGSCIGLAIDNPKNNEHYLEHLMLPSEDEVRASITNNFQNLNNLHIFIVEGSYKNSIGMHETLKALKHLRLLNQAKYSSSESFMLREGDIYSTDFR